MATPSATPTVIPTSEKDYLTEDPELRGQKYVCLSFLSPEDILANKDVFYFERYVADYAKNMETLFAGLKNKFGEEAKAMSAVIDSLTPEVKAIEAIAGNPETDTAPETVESMLLAARDKNNAAIEMLNTIRDLNMSFFDSGRLQDDFRFFRNQNSDELEREFHELNAFRTTVRGIKVRGVYETVVEAQGRCEYLKKQGDKFNIYIGTVGCWCPWNPSPDQMDSKFDEDHLNTLMSKNVESMSIQDQTFEKRKIDAVMASVAPSTSAAASDLPSAASDLPSAVSDPVPE